MRPPNALVRPPSARLIWVCMIMSCATAAHGQCDFSESFDQGTDHAWEFTDPTAVAVQDDVLEIQFTGPPNHSEWAILEACSYTDLYIHVRMRDLNGSGNKIVRFRNFGSGGEINGYGVNVRSSPFNDVVLAKKLYGPTQILAAAYLPFTHETDQWVRVDIFVSGATVNVHVNGGSLIQFTDPTPIASGWVGLTVHAGNSGIAHAQFDDFQIGSYGAVATVPRSWSTLKSQFDF